MIKKILLLVTILPSLLNAMIDIEDAEHAARHGRIEELRRSYIAITDPEKDKIIIPTIRIYGHLDAFYMSLVHNGDVDILQTLMRIDHLLTPHAISTIFDAAPGYVCSDRLC